MTHNNHRRAISAMNLGQSRAELHWHLLLHQLAEKDIVPHIHLSSTVEEKFDFLACTQSYHHGLVLGRLPSTLRDLSLGLAAAAILFGFRPFPLINSHQARASFVSSLLAE